MRKFLLITALLTGIFSNFLTLQAKPVDKATAAQMAARVLNKAVADATPTQFTECYLFTGADGKGFVLMAADDCVRPVLAYSLDGTFDPTDIPDPVAWWIDGYQREIASVVAAGASPSSKVAEEWERWSQGIPRSKSTQVDPLMTTQWSQSFPYNFYCPYDTVYNNYSAVGCVATAMAQIMRYHQWPEVGYGSHSYEWSYYGTLSARFDTTHYHWDLMPNSLTSACSDAEINAVATLMYHAGVATEMMYHPEGSAAYSFSTGGFDFPSAENALKSYFSYNPMLFSRHKGDYSDTEWDALMRAELDAHCPVLYSASEPYLRSGHAFVIDGYDSTGMFHVNWGWGGPADAWYTLDSLAPEYQGHVMYRFTGIADALFEVYPAGMTAGVPSTINIVSNDPSLGTVTGSGTYATSDTVHVQVQAAEGCRFVRMASGRRNLPFDFLASGENYTDTAIFERITGDTVGFCGDTYVEDQPYGESGVIEWGIRIPAVMRQGKKLSAVQFYYLTEGDYTVKIYDNPLHLENITPVYSKTHHLRGGQGWRTLALDSTLSFAPDKAAWIVLSYNDTTGWASPAAADHYRGTPDGSWYLFADGWDFYHPIGGYYTWLIRAVLENTVGIEEIEDSELKIEISGLDMKIDNPDGETVQIYDITGRQLSTSHLSPFTFHLPSPGVYIVKAGNHPARKIVAIR